MRETETGAVHSAPVSTPMWQEILEQIWGDDEGWAHLICIYGDQRVAKAFHWPKHKKSLFRHINEMKDFANVYFNTQLMSSKTKCTKDETLPTRWVWVDQDAGGYETLDPRPTICWETSPGKCQGLWDIGEYVETEELETINKALMRLNKSDAVWNSAHKLRVPGTLNHKKEHKPPFEGSVAWADGPVYTKEQLMPVQVEEPAPKKVTTTTATIELPTTKKITGGNDLTDVGTVLLEHGQKIPKNIWAMLTADPTGVTDHSARLWHMNKRLLEVGVPAEAVFTIAKASPWNKFARERRKEKDLWEDIQRAATGVAPPAESPEESKGLPWMSLDDLLKHAEQPTWLVDDIWMSKNVGWIAGVGKSYKSVISLDLGLSVALNVPFLDTFPVREAGSVLMVQEEDPRWRMANRAQVMCEKKGIDNVTVERNNDQITFRIRDVNIPFHTAIGAGFNFSSEDKMDSLEEAIDLHKPQLVVLDPMFMMAAGVDEFKSSEITGILLKLKHWRNKYNCAIAVVHHYRKGGGSDYDVERIYGSMALYAWSENNLLVGRKKGGNVSVIQTDIKDAPASQRIIVNFHDLDSTYDIKVTQEVAEENDDKVHAFLAAGEIDATYSLDEIMRATQLGDRTVRKRIKSLEERNLVRVETAGAGGRYSITPLEELLKKDDDIIF